MERISHYRLVARLGKGAMERLKYLEEHSATNADMDRRHDENLTRFDRLEEKIDSGITGTHQRIDKLFERLPERK